MQQAVFGTSITSAILSSVYRIGSIIYACKTNKVETVNPVAD